MEIPKGATLYEHPLASYWMDSDGIWYAVSKETPRTLEMMRDNVAFLKKIFENKRVCLIADASKVSPYDKETRNYLAKELNNLYKAMAIISTSSIGRMVANTFILSHLLNPLPVPMKMFKNEKEAKEWLREYL